MNAPLPCQRHLFEIPDDVAYLDAAAWSPLPRSVREAGEAGMLVKSRPWSHPREAVPAQAERARSAAAALLNAGADDIAIVGSVSHAMATAAKNLSPDPGGRIVRIVDEFPSLCFAFDRLAAERGLEVEIVPRPADGDWTQSLLDAIHRPGAPPLTVATLTPLHWADGTVIDLDRIAPAVHAAGAALIIDATQAVGAVPVDVARWRPDFLAFPTYKWALGPYGLAFLYAAKHRQGGTPIEENNGNRPPATGARRYDRGELNDPVALPMAATGLELIAGWGVPSIAARLLELSDSLAEGLVGLGFTLAPAHLRSPHMLGAYLPDGLPDRLIGGLREHNVFVSDRLGALRVSPHVFANEKDVARCLDAVRARLAG